MKPIITVALGLSTLGILTSTGCSHMGSKDSATEMSAVGPSIMNERVSAGTVELNRKLQPNQSPEVLADVKDFKSNVVSVKLKFQHVPLEIPMQNVGGTTWRAKLTSNELKQLAVSGQTTRYDANVVAKNSAGQTAIGKKPVTLSVKAPDLAESA